MMLVTPVVCLLLDYTLKVRSLLLFEQGMSLA